MSSRGRYIVRKVSELEGDRVELADFPDHPGLRSEGYDR